MEASTYKPSELFSKELEDELMKFTTNYEERKVNSQLIEQQQKVSEEVIGSSKEEVNITECTRSGGRELAETEHLDATESSSSFGNSDSDSENFDPSGDTEIMSDLRINDAASTQNFGRLSEPFKIRKKKLTNQWRSFIEPLMWRCKWTELKALQFQSQAQKYDRELDEFLQQKKFQYQNYMSESQSAKSCQFSSNITRSSVLMRKKRKRTEETRDPATYMAQHNLFSFYENRKYLAKGPFRDDELKNQVITVQKVDIDDDLDEQSFLEPGDGNSSLELILGKIELLRSEVFNMKSRIEKVLKDEAGKFPLGDELSLPMPFQSLASSPQNASSKNGDRTSAGNILASQLKSEHNIVGALFPESAETNSGDTVPDENGIDYLACSDDAYKKGEDGLIGNHEVKEEMNSLEEVKSQQIPSPSALNDELDSTTDKVMAEADPPAEMARPPKMHSVSKLTAPKTQRKGRKRKVGAGKRGRRLTC